MVHLVISLSACTTKSIECAQADDGTPICQAAFKNYSAHPSKLILNHTSTNGTLDYEIGLRSLVDVRLNATLHQLIIESEAAESAAGSIALSPFETGLFRGRVPLSQASVAGRLVVIAVIYYVLDGESDRQHRVLLYNACFVLEDDQTEYRPPTECRQQATAIRGPSELEAYIAHKVVPLEDGIPEDAEGEFFSFPPPEHTFWNTLA